jgi:sugar lactone lactonase YvrE
MKIKNVVFYRTLGMAAFAGAVLLAAGSAPAQNLFVGTYATSDVSEIDPGGTQCVFATGLGYPSGLVFDSAGDLFVGSSADNYGTGNIIEIMPNGVQNVFATGLDPQGLAMNSAGDLFEADYKTGNIYEFTPNGVRSTFGRGFYLPLSLAVNSAGDVFAGAGIGNGQGYITEIAPNGVQTVFAGGLNYPDGLAFNSAGDLFVSSQNDGAICEYTPGGAKSIFANVSASGISGLAFNSTGDLFAATSSGCIVEITPDGKQSTFATIPGICEGLAFEPVPEPSSLALASLGSIAFLFRRRSWRTATVSD